MDLPSNFFLESVTVTLVNAATAYREAMSTVVDWFHGWVCRYFSVRECHKYLYNVVILWWC
jgi:hypothetical protein